MLWYSTTKVRFGAVPSVPYPMCAMFVEYTRRSSHIGATQLFGVVADPGVALLSETNCPPGKRIAPFAPTDMSVYAFP